MPARVRVLGLFGLRWLAFGLALSALLLGADYWWSNFRSAPYNDFSLTYFAARTGLAHGWVSIYNLSLQRQAFDAFYRHQVPFGSGYYYTNSPIGAWLAVPFASLPEQAGYWIWAGLMIGAFVAAWYLLTAGAWLERIGILCLVLGTYPAIYGLRLGQPVGLAVLAVALCYRWLDRRPWAAGAILGLALVKPYLVLLLPLGFVVTRRYRVLVAAAAVTGATAVAILLVLGPGGTRTMLATEALERTVFWNIYLTLLRVLGGGWPAVAGVSVAGLLAVSAAWVNRNRSELWMPALIVGSLLVAPYLHSQDYAILAPAGMLVWRAFDGLAVRLWLGLGVLLAEFLMPLGPVPLLAYEVLSLCWLGYAGLAATMPARRSPVPAPSSADGRSVA